MKYGIAKNNKYLKVLRERYAIRTPEQIKARKEYLHDHRLSIALKRTIFDDMKRIEEKRINDIKR